MEDDSQVSQRHSNVGTYEDVHSSDLGVQSDHTVAVEGRVVRHSKDDWTTIDLFQRVGQRDRCRIVAAVEPHESATVSAR